MSDNKNWSFQRPELQLERRDSAVAKPSCKSAGASVAPVKELSITPTYGVDYGANPYEALERMGGWQHGRKGS